MLLYELAKKLKEAGFPQPKDYIGDTPLDMGIIPPLEELIDACGDDFNGIVKVMKKFYPEQSEWWWEAVSKKGYKYGDTPEESVANLWLFLNKKQCPK